MIASTLCSTLLGSAFHARQTLTWPRIWPVSDQSDNQTWMSPSVNPSVSVLAIDNSNPNSFSDQLFSMSECANLGGDASLLWSSLHHPDLLLDPLCCYCESSNLCPLFNILVQMSILSCTLSNPASKSPWSVFGPWWPGPYKSCLHTV